MRKFFDIIFEIALLIIAVMLVVAAYGQTGMEAEITNIQALLLIVLSFQFRGARERAQTNKKLGLDND